jgi:hypothetical protein
MSDVRFTKPQPPLFPPGEVVATPEALDWLALFQCDPTALLAPRLRGDWGDVPAEDARENEYSLRHGLRILSSYPICDNAAEGCTAHRIWLLTEADRSVTTILRPEDY